MLKAREALELLKALEEVASDQEVLRSAIESLRKEAKILKNRQNAWLFGEGGEKPQLIPGEYEVPLAPPFVTMQSGVGVSMGMDGRGLLVYQNPVRRHAGGPTS